MALSNEELAREVLAADDARNAAMVAGDVPALERCLSEQLSYTHSSGFRDGKASYLASLRAGKVRYHSVRREETTVEPLGETAALMHGRLILAVSIDGQEKTVDSLFSSVWVLHEGGWQLRALSSVAGAQPQA